MLPLWFESDFCQNAVDVPLQTLGGAVAQSVERMTPGQEVLSSIPAVDARSLLLGSVSV